MITKSSYLGTIGCFSNSLDGLVAVARAMDFSGPFFFGDTMSIVDISLVPWFQRYVCTPLLEL